MTEDQREALECEYLTKLMRADAVAWAKHQLTLHMGAAGILDEEPLTANEASRTHHFSAAQMKHGESHVTRAETCPKCGGNRFYRNGLGFNCVACLKASALSPRRKEAAARIGRHIFRREKPCPRCGGFIFAASGGCTACRKARNEARQRAKLEAAA